ncbi:MAG: hypothetical protein JZU63_02525 [Rhodoferax sp.]|nr:hypothetical protein [Rhodoferax sp.]
MQIRLLNRLTQKKRQCGQFAKLCLLTPSYVTAKMFSTKPLTGKPE